MYVGNKGLYPLLMKKIKGHIWIGLLQVIIGKETASWDLGHIWVLTITSAKYTQESSTYQ